MANIAEVSVFTPDVYQIEITDPLEGGAGGVMNFQAQSLANRTLWLKDENTLRDSEITALEILANKYFPKKRGTINNLNPGESSGTKATTGDMTNCAVSSSESGTDFVSTTYLVTMTAGLANVNYKVNITLQNTGVMTTANDCLTPVFEPISATQFRVSLQAQVGAARSIKMHFDVISLD